jgi:hypothetical protein
MPIANAPTMGDSPRNAAIPAAAKNAAVTIPSKLPLDFHNLSVCRILGMINTETISIAAKVPSTCIIRSIMSITAGSVLPV